MPTIVHNPGEIDFDLAGKHHYHVAFHLDGTWGYSLLPLTVVNGRRGLNRTNLIVFGGTQGDEYDGQIAVQRLCADVGAATMPGRALRIASVRGPARTGSTRVCPVRG